MDEGSDTSAAPKTGEAGRPDPEEDPPLPAPLQQPDPTAKKKKGCRCRCPACPTLSSKAVIDVLLDAPQFYCQTLASRPLLYLMFWMIVVLVVLPVTWRPISVDTDVNAYRRADTAAARHHLVYLDSLNNMRAVRNESALGERTTLKLELLYEAKDGDVFAESVLRDIRAFEQALRSLEGWSKLCNMSEPALQFQCSPGESFGNYVWPKRLDNFLTSDGFFRLSFDGSASERLPLDAVVAYLREGRAHPHELRVFLPMDFTEGGSSRLLRSIFGFTAPSLDDAEFRKTFQDFVENQLYTAMKEVVLFTRQPVDPTSWDKPPSMQIYFRGDLLDDYEVLQALHGDMLLAIGPLILSLILAWVKFRSAFLAFGATIFLCLTVLLAYAILPVEKVSLASFLGVFMIFGLGFTSFFRMHELWRRSRLEAVDLSERLLYLHTAAGREMLPVVCTSLCYFLLLTSNLVPLREFGIFIGTSMLLAVALAVLCFVPVLLLHEVHVRPWLRRRAGKLILALEPAQLKPDWEMLASKIMLLLRRPKPLLGGTALVVFICAVAALAVTAQQPYPELPEVFPQEHHREAGRPLLQSFQHVKPAEEAAPYTIRMCEPGRNLSCALHWCDLHNTATSNLTEWPSTEAASCSCWTPVDMTTMCSNITVSMTISGSRVSELTQDVVMPQVESFMQQQFSDADYLETSSVASRRLQSVVLEDWPTGATHVDPLTQMPDISLGFPTPRLSTSSCRETHYCYCSPKVCLNPTGYQRTSSDLSLPALSTTSDSTTATSQTSTEVLVLFGIKEPSEYVNLLAKTIKAEFDTSFDPASPWAQRAMLRVCDELAPTLQVLSSRCWILDFRAWLYSRGQKFPVERFLDFHQTLKDFLVSYPSASSSMWFDASDNLTATMFSFQVTPANGATATLAARDLWLTYLSQMNADASSTASNAWVTSQAWVDAASLQDALTSAWQVLLAVMAVVFLVGLAYVLDVELVLALLLTAFCVCSGIVFFFFCLCGWSFGPWELTILTVFLSYSVEPAFHIGHDFINPGLPEALRAEKPLTSPDLAAASGAGPPAPALTDADASGDAGEPTPQVPQHADGLSLASEVNPKHKDTPQEAIQRSIHLVAKNLVSNSLKLMLCGILLAFSQLRLFSRLGAISILLPLLVVPSVLLVYPAIILASGRQRREPDLLVFGTAMINKLSWLWT